ncbi:ABC transporter ATP-binding protein [Virgibacillus halodenitrificans]|uniref:response regulator transcription factor n=1 Tax=Virgibacillus halodenitrificans TaxID=1482 RepID=UPI00136C28C9|nr:response regulator transcription factor [Virgibacillus halodenitrificans]MYL45679.1 ABC transporter ATP-binding protein [Virgibacillus halodenitrificans]
MAHFTINQKMTDSDSLPSFNLTLDGESVTTIYGDNDMQTALVDALRTKSRIPVFDQQEGLYHRLTVGDNVGFFHKWFNCKVPLPEVFVLFELQNCLKKPLHRCTDSEIRRVYFAKYLMSGITPTVFREPLHGVDIKTIQTFITLLEKFKERHIPVLILVANMEHALLLGDVAYKLQQSGIHPIELEEDEVQPDETSFQAPAIANLFKVPAKVDDKVILFDPLEIDYIESQDGKAMMVINDASYPMESTLSEIEKKLEVYGFYRCHRSYIVNLQKVREIITWSKNTYSLRMDNKSQSTIPLSRTKIQDIQEKFSLR